MSFQGSINNLLSTVAVASRLSPGFESKQAAAAAEKKLKVLEKQQAQITEATEGSTEHKIYQDIQEQKKAASKQLFEAKPSSKTYNQYRRRKTKYTKRRSNSRSNTFLSIQRTDILFWRRKIFFIFSH